jgi:DNA (cytosine-5)-methyltransferase 1
MGAPIVSAFHIRQRLWFVAHTESSGCHSGRSRCEGENRGGPYREPERPGLISPLDDSQRERTGRGARSKGCEERTPQGSREGEGGRQLQTLYAGAISELGYAESEGLQGERRESSTAIGHERGRFTRLPSDAWANCDWLSCVDGKARPVESGTFPLAHGVSARVGRLRGYGNAIVPQVAQVFITAYMECREWP